jgi:ligand-binding sensor domain-containing protein/uncharacterized membrane-anchored protein YhcB (DUF1043 family)
MRKFLLLLLLLKWTFGWSQVPNLKSHEFAYEYQSLKVNQILADKQGFVWMSTQLGLFQHDGMNISHFPFPDSLQNQSIQFIVEGPGKVIYIGTNKGKLYQLKDQDALVLNEQFKDTKFEGLSCISFDLDGNAWIGTNGAGLLLLHEGKIMQISKLNGLADLSINSIASDKYGNMWIGTDAGLSKGKFINGQLELSLFNGNNHLQDPFITLVRQSIDGRILIGTQSKGLFFVDSYKGNSDAVCQNDIWEYGAVKEIIQESNKFWIATEESGLMLVENRKIKHEFSHGHKGINQRLSSITKDKEGNIWIADKSEQVISFNNLFSYLRLPKEMHGDIRSLAVDMDGGVWFSDLNQCYFWKEGKYVELPTAVKKIKAVHIYPDSNGYIWFATFGKGVFRFEPKQGSIVNFTEKNGLSNDNVISISGNKERIFFATFGGVSYVKGKDGFGQFLIKSANKEYGLPMGYYYQVLLDKRGGVWFVSDGLGVFHLKNNLVQNFGRANGLTSRIVNAICEDALGNIWLNSPEAGLFKYNGTKFENFGANAGIRELGYNAIVADEGENLIVVNGKGIDMLNIKNGNVLYHDHEIGFDVEPQANKIACKNSLGKIWIGSGRNLIMHDSRLNNLWDGPKPIIKRAYLFLTPFSMGSKHEFSFEENHITFDYVGVWYHLPEEVNYLIKLEGYDRDWVRSRDMQITYPKLPPGSYTFKLRALPSNNFKATQEVSYSFVISKPFYGSYWFYLLIACVIALVVWLIMRIRISQLKEKERIENDKIKYQFETLRSQINPHFLFNSFNTLSDIIERRPDDAVEYVEHLSDFFRHILQYKEKDLISLKAELGILEDYLFIQKKRFGDSLNIKIEGQILDSNYLIAPMTLQILAENAIKHNVVSKAKPLTIEISVILDDYVMVTNILQPKNSVEPSTQIGLSNIVSRYEILQGRKVLVEKNESHFIVKIPLIKNV